MSDSRTNDEELIKQLVDGEQSALAKLFELNRYRLQRMIAVRMDQRLKGRVDEADILQEAFMILSKKIDSYDTNMSPYVWMRLTVLDQLIAEHRKHIRAGKRDARREVSISQKVGDESSTELAATLEANDTSIRGKVATLEVTKHIRDTLSQMDEKDRDIIIMRIFENMSNTEVAEILDLTPNGASSRFSRALERLQREVFSDRSPDESRF